MHGRSHIGALRFTAVLLLALVLGSFGAVARASTPQAALADVELLVDTSSLEVSLGERLQVALEQQLAQALRSDGFEVVRGGALVTVEVRLTMRDVDLREYVISLEVIADGVREVIVEAEPCLACSEQKVVERIVELLPEVGNWRPEPEPPAPCVAAASEPTPEPGGRRRLGIGRLGFTGAVSFSAGLATIGAGALMMSLPELDWDVDPRTAGVGILVVGTAATALGATMLVVDVALLEGRHRKLSMSVSPNLSPTNGGVLVVGRF
jgi:hypothetical protein